MKTIIIFIMLSVIAMAQDSTDASLEFNPFEESWEFTYPDDILQYNPMEDSWEFTDPEAKLEYNPFENSWEFIDPNDKK